jgi:uncharacterized membrane protein YdjX (TVP38/TMEM64 family)
MSLQRFKHLLPLALLLAGMIALWWFGLQQDLSWASLARNQAMLRHLVATWPISAGAAYIALYIAVVACSLPESAAVTVAGGLLFGTVPGGVLAIVGSSIGAVILFVAARYALADMVQERAGSLMARIRPGLERNGFYYLLAIRLVPLFPFWLVNLAAAGCGMRVLPFAAATLIGVIPATLVFAAIGTGLGDVLARGQRPDLSAAFSPYIVLPLLGLAALSLLPVAWRAWKGRDG